MNRSCRSVYIERHCRQSIAKSDPLCQLATHELVVMDVRHPNKDMVIMRPSEYERNPSIQYDADLMALSRNAWTHA